MDKYLREQIKLIERLLEKQPKGTDWEAVQRLHRARIGFLQHERLIHLLITLFFGMIFFINALGILLTASWGLLVLAPILMIMTLAYVWHYYLLENGVQKLYRLDGEIEKKLKG